MANPNLLGTPPSVKRTRYPITGVLPAIDGEQFIGYWSITNGTLTAYTVPVGKELWLCSATCSRFDTSASTLQARCTIHDSVPTTLYMLWGNQVGHQYAGSNNPVAHSFWPPLVMDPGWYFELYSAAANVYMRLSVFGYLVEKAS